MARCAADGEEFNELEDLHEEDGGNGRGKRRLSDSVESDEDVGHRRRKKEKLEAAAAASLVDLVGKEGDDGGKGGRKRGRSDSAAVEDDFAGDRRRKEEDFIGKDDFIDNGDTEDDSVNKRDMGKRPCQSSTFLTEDQEDVEEMESNVEEQALLPSMNNNTQKWMVKCALARREGETASFLRKCINKPELQIQSAIASDHLAAELVSIEENVVASKWSQLLEEILHQILKRLSPPDWHQFGSVCKSWRSALNARRVTPLLVRMMNPFPRGIEEPNDVELIGFCLRDDKFQQSSMKIAYDMGYSCLRCLSCVDGWFGANATYQNHSPDRLTMINLVNPMTGVQIHLPLIKGRIHRLALSSNPTSANCRVVARGKFYTCYNGIMNLASCTVGDCEWNYFDACSLYSNMIFHKGRLYVHSEGSSTCETRVYAFDPHAKMIGSVAVVGEEKRLYNGRFVDAGDGLLLVVQDFKSTETSGFRVFKLRDDGNLIRVRRIRDGVVLLDQHTSICLSIKQIADSSFRANCIYIYKHSMDGNYFLEYSVDDESFRRLPDDTPQASVELGWWLSHDW